jgi:hypothetical protein
MSQKSRYAGDRHVDEIDAVPILPFPVLFSRKALGVTYNQERMRGAAAGTAPIRVWPERV